MNQLLSGFPERIFFSIFSVPHENKNSKKEDKRNDDG